MPRILALEWDNHEIRYLHSESQGEKISVLAADSFPLSDINEEAADRQPLGESVKKALDSLSIGRATVLVGVRRANIELLHFNLPPTEDIELPELVRNLAIRESNLVSDDSVLDYVVRDDEPSEQQQVTAVALLPGEFDEINSVCKTAGITPQKILLRPYSTASLFNQSHSRSTKNCLLVTRYADEVDFILLNNHQVTSWRTIHLPQNNDEAALKTLIGETNRTLLVASQENIGEIQEIYVSGSSEDNRELLERIDQQLSIPAFSYDPFENVEFSAGSLPPHTARFTSLLGMASREVHNRLQPIDFLHPKKQPKPFNYRRASVIAGSVISLLLLFLIYSTWSRISAEDKKFEDGTNRLEELNALVKKAEKRLEVTNALQRWQANNITWLDELYDLSRRFPTARDAVVLSMTQTRAASGGGTVKLYGLVRDPLIVSKMESRLRDKYREITSRNFQEIGPDKSHSWRFDSTISITQREKELYVTKLSNKTPGQINNPSSEDSPANSLQTNPKVEVKEKDESP